MTMRNLLLFGYFSLVLTLFAGGSVVPVGTYLYANLEKLPDKPGVLVLSFTTAGPKRLVIAYGRRNRKDRKDRDGTTEAERELYKPRLAKLSPDGRTARFEKLPPDFYDIIVIDPANMVIHEGISLWDSSEEQVADGAQIAGFQDEIRKSLGLRDDRIGGWEGFFDNKQIERVEVADGRAGVFMQQMRLGVALAESGEKLKGYIHSVDVVWVERSLDDGKSGWQVRGRQQLYRDEIEARSFFRHVRMAELTGIRVGVREKRLDNIELK